jgi:hypothetical protein
MLLGGHKIMALEFIKSLFKDNEALTYEDLEKAATEAKINGVNIADGSYVSRDKFNDKVGALTQQVTDLTGQITQRDTDLSTLQTKLTEAQADSGKLAEVQAAFSGLQTQYTADKEAMEQQMRRQSYEFMVREKANQINFSSAAAKREFIRDAIAKDFKVDGETLLGYEDFLTKYKADDPTAFAQTKELDVPDPKKPDIVLPPKQQPAPNDPNAFHFNFTGVRPMPKADN